jgi:hypothetical protein
MSISLLSANVIYVNKTATGNNSGNSWANAYINLQSAITASLSGDQIWVAKGVYTPSLTNTSVSFSMKSGVSLYGGFLGNEANISARNWLCNKTILSGDLSGNDTSAVSTHAENSINVVSFLNQTTNAVLNGFTIEGAYSVSYVFWDLPRGGIYAWQSSNVKILNCTIKDNRAHTGGGIAIYGSSAEISNCIVTNNYARDDGGGIDLAFDMNIDVKNCLVTNNLCDDIGGAAGSGSGIRIVHNQGSAESSDVYNFENCTVANNLANSTSTIGGICITNGYARARFKNCIIYGNANKDIGYGTIDQLIATAVGSNSSSIPSTYTANPQFVSTTDFTLSPGSPYINAGNNGVSTTSLDLNNSNRINNGIIDLGAYEYGNTIAACSELSVEDTHKNQQQFSIFPNPVRDILNIKTEQQLKSVQIFDMNGRIIQSIVSPQKQINVSKLIKGNYIIKITSEKASIAEKFIKQ